MEILALHLRHLPRRYKKLKIGIKSRAASLYPHCGQREYGYAIDSPLGILYMHTFIKLPMTVPRIKIKRFTRPAPSAMFSL